MVYIEFKILYLNLKEITISNVLANHALDYSTIKPLNP